MVDCLEVFFGIFDGDLHIEMGQQRLDIADRCRWATEPCPEEIQIGPMGRDINDPWPAVEGDVSGLKRRFD